MKKKIEKLYRPCEEFEYKLNEVIDAINGEDECHFCKKPAPNFPGGCVPMCDDCLDKPDKQEDEVQPDDFWADEFYNKVRAGDFENKDEIKWDEVANYIKQVQNETLSAVKELVRELRPGYSAWFRRWGRTPDGCDNPNKLEDWIGNGWDMGATQILDDLLEKLEEL